MAIKNNRKSILSTPEDRLKNKLKENYRRFLKEDDEESADLEDLGGEELPAEDGGEDLGLDAEGGDDLGAELGADEIGAGDELADEEIGADLTDEQAETVDNWVDELLGDSLDTVEVADEEALDIEAGVDEIDPMGEEQTIHDDLPLTVDELNNIIDSDDSLAALEDALIGLATEEGSEELVDVDVDGASELEGLEDETIEDADAAFDGGEEEELDEHSRAWNKATLKNQLGEEEEVEGEELEESEEEVEGEELNEEADLEEGIGSAIKSGINAIKGVAQKAKKFYDDEISPNSVKPGGKYHGKHATLASNIGEAEEAEGEELNEADLEAAIRELGFDQGYEGVDTKDELAEDVQLAAGNKELGFEEVAGGLNDKITSTVSDKGIEGGAKSNVETVNESIKKSKMLVTAAGVIAKLQESAKAQKAEIEALKLENYKLIKANGLLSVAGDKISAEARTKISESFDACKSVKQVDAFYTKLAESIRQINRPTLNEAVSTKKTKIQVIKEANAPKADGEEKAALNESVSSHQNRLNYLMGMDSAKDAYFDF